MFGGEYYCLVAGFKELTLDAENKGVDAASIIGEVISQVSARDAKAVKLLYAYYDCENIAAARAGRTRHNPLGLLSREEIEEELREPSQMPAQVASVLQAYASGRSEEIDASVSFERALFEAYYAECAASSSSFVREWSQTDRNLRNIAAAISARGANIPIDQVVVGEGDVADALRHSSATDFGLRGELPYIDAVIVAINDEQNIVEKEHKIDNIRWAEVDEAAAFDYFNINAVLSYLVKLNIVARWTTLDEKKGRQMLDKLMRELSAKDKINK